MLMCVLSLVCGCSADVVRFDNTYSVIHSKKISFTVDVLLPEGQMMAWITSLSLNVFIWHTLCSEPGTFRFFCVTQNLCMKLKLFSESGKSTWNVNVQVYLHLKANLHLNREPVFVYERWWNAGWWRLLVEVWIIY